jgi:hypothetical protein
MEQPANEYGRMVLMISAYLSASYFVILVILQLVTLINVPFKFFDSSSKLMMSMYTLIFLAKSAGGFLYLYEEQ